jgi:acyl carrier protein
VLGWTSEAAVDETRGFFSLGMDSIMTVDLRARLQAALGCELATTVALEYPTVRALSLHLLDEIVLRGARRTAAARLSASGGTPAPDALDGRSEAELAALLDRAIDRALGGTGDLGQ